MISDVSSGDFRQGYKPQALQWWHYVRTIAERNGLIGELTAWVLNAAMAQRMLQAIRNSGVTLCAAPFDLPFVIAK